MSIDMTQFYQIFFEEAEEHLSEMEKLLLSLDIANPGAEDLNAIFRAAHSIKGGSGTFGFTDVAEVTHVLESLLDKLRKGELDIRKEMIDAFLRATDVIKLQLAAHRGEGERDEAAEQDICRELEAFSEADAPLRNIEATLQAGEHAQLLERLKEIGRVEIIECPEQGPWRIRIETSQNESTLREMFEFFLSPEAFSFSTGEEESYGFFEPVQEEEAFGFFEPVQEEQSYGFFEPLPDVTLAPPEQPREAVQSSAKAQPKPTVQGETIRVSVEKVDQLINLVGELVITEAMLAQTTAGLESAAFEALQASLAQLERNTRDLQESVMSIRMMPISFVFSRFPRLVRDLAGKLDKQVELITEGENTELDKGLIERIADPLTHLVRNSLDHGIESSSRRIAAGKNPVGSIRLRAFHRGGSIVVEVADDGAGLNRKKILEKAASRGLAVHEGMPDQEVWQLIFEAGFSTAEVVTDVSGRGVGMDVVKRNIHELGGRIEIDSVEGTGTRISISLPLTLAILDGMSIGVSDQTLIIPLNCIVETLQPQKAEIKSVSGEKRLLGVRGEFVPLIVLHEVFNLPPKAQDIEQGVAVIVEVDSRKTALIVDDLLGQHQVVIKSLESNYRKVHGISGATIMGDGRVALILDVGELLAA